MGWFFDWFQWVTKVTLSWIIASRFAVVHSICLRKLAFTLLRVISAFLYFVQSVYAKSAWSSLKIKLPTIFVIELCNIYKYDNFTSYFRPKRTIKYKRTHRERALLTFHNKKQSLFRLCFKWRRRWDSNPRYARTYDGFQDRSNQPLWHSSKVIQLVTKFIIHETYLIVKRFVKILFKHGFFSKFVL